MSPVTTEQLLDTLLRIADALGADMDGYLRRYGLTPTRAHLLWTLHTRGPSKQRDLARALGHSPRHVTTLVDELAAAGHVTRQVHPEDRRAVLVELTPVAADLLEEMAAARIELAGQLFGQLSPDTRTQLGHQLTELGQRLAALVEAQP
jgi:DNA-binding MarR family transcriptional regulator